MPTAKARTQSEPRTLTRAEARPCPFCGTQPTIQPWHGGGPRKRLVACDNERCDVRPQVSGASAKTALARWNFRVKE